MAFRLHPTEPVALDAPRKRKHGEIVDLTREAAEEPPPSRRLPPAQNGNHAPGPLPSEVNEESDTNNDSDGDSDGQLDAETMEDIVDTFELEPYIAQEEDGVSDAQAAAWRAQLRRDGVEKFFKDTIITGNEDPRRLGIAFGLNPEIGVSDDMYLRLLGLVVMRCFYKRQKLPQHNTIDDAAALLQRCRNIIVITGAGISTSLGVPDFRSKGTGFYDQVRELGYQEAEEVFDIHTFDQDPQDFYTLAGMILPDMNHCTPTHAFIRLLQDQSRLLTNYTQNIDNLEHVAGIDESKYIQCHGSFATASCRKCGHSVPGEDIFANIRAKQVAICKKCTHDIQTAKTHAKPKKKTKWNLDDDDDADDDDDIPQPGVMKPDITFFGEQLPNKFFNRLTDHDAQRADLVIVIGTSMKVAPVSEIPNYLPHPVPHIYISKEPIKHVAFDIQLLGNCDDVVVELCKRAGWTLKHEMIPTDFAAQVRRFDEQNGHMWTVERAQGT